MQLYCAHFSENTEHQNTQHNLTVIPFCNITAVYIITNNSSLFVKREICFHANCCYVINIFK